MYEIKIGDKIIGYINEKQDIEEYINSSMQEEVNVAFIDFKENIEYNLKLVNRNQTIDDDKIKSQILENTNIEYTTYAITYNGKNIAYVSQKEEAETVIQNLKDDKIDTTNVGILQVYSDNYDEIKSMEVEESTKEVTTNIKNSKKQSTVKISKTSNTKTKNSIFTVKPISGVITSRFGSRNSPGGIGSTNHKGLDISAKQGTTIKAAASGTVKFSGYKGSLGNLVIIESSNGIQTYYGHCSKLYVKKGQKVKAGDKIAAVGQTGAATGPHLHLEIHVNGTAVNPQKYLYK